MHKVSIIPANRAFLATKRALRRRSFLIFYYFPSIVNFIVINRKRRGRHATPNPLLFARRATVILMYTLQLLTLAVYDLWQEGDFSANSPPSSKRPQFKIVFFILWTFFFIVLGSEYIVLRFRYLSRISRHLFSLADRLSVILLIDF